MKHRLPIVFGLGSNVGDSNLGDSEAILRWALAELGKHFGPLQVAPLYRTAPISAIAQPDFLNTVALAPLAPAEAPGPEATLALAKDLECRAGRRADDPRDAPRPLDVDLLLYGDRVLGDPRAASGTGLVVPHPRLRLRRFVLAPLAALAPDLALPPDGARVRDLLAALGPGQRVERIG